jgi:hypothetical protein
MFRLLFALMLLLLFTVDLPVVDPGFETDPEFVLTDGFETDPGWADGFETGVVLLAAGLLAAGFATFFC